MSFETVKIDKKSGTQTIQIPEDFSIDDDKVYLKKVGKSLYVIPYHNPWESLIQSTNLFTKDFLEKRDQPEAQKRDFFG